MNLELKLNYEEDGQNKTISMALDVSGEKEASYSLETALGEVLFSFQPKARVTETEPEEQKSGGSFGFPDFNAELRKKMEERQVFASKHRTRR